MPRCYNDSKTVSSVSSDYKHSTDDIILTQSHAFSIGSQLNVDEDPPVVEKSHRRLRCDLSPVPTSTNSNLNIKLFGLKVRCTFLHILFYVVHRFIVSCYVFTSWEIFKFYILIYYILYLHIWNIEYCRFHVIKNYIWKVHLNI